MSYADQRQVNRHLWRADRCVEAFHKDFKEGHEGHISCIEQVEILQPAVDVSIGENGIPVGGLTLSCCRSTRFSGGSFPPGGYADSDGGCCPESSADLCLYDTNMSDVIETTENGILDTFLGSKQSRPTMPQT